MKKQERWKLDGLHDEGVQRVEGNDDRAQAKHGAMKAGAQRLADAEDESEKKKQEAQRPAKAQQRSLRPPVKPILGRAVELAPEAVVGALAKGVMGFVISSLPYQTVANANPKTRKYNWP